MKKCFSYIKITDQSLELDLDISFRNYSKIPKEGFSPLFFAHIKNVVEIQNQKLILNLLFVDFIYHSKADQLSIFSKKKFKFLSYNQCMNKFLSLLAIVFAISSCGGGGGGPPR